MKIDPTKVLTSNPPKPCYYCSDCDGELILSGCFNIGSVIMNPDILVSFGGKTKKLEPISDISTIELWNLFKWTEMVKINSHASPEDLYKKAVDYGIDRHFKDL